MMPEHGNAKQPAPKERLKALIKERALRTGRELTLASGRLSTFYFDMKAAMLHPEGAWLIGTLLLETAADFQPDFIGGLEMGAVPAAAAAAALSHGRGRPLPAFFVRKAAKDHGTRNRIEGLAPGESLSGRRAVIVEDVTTSGGSALEAAAAVREAGGVVAGVVTIVDRGEGAAEAFAAAGLSFRAVLTAADLLE